VQDIRVERLRQIKAEQGFSYEQLAQGIGVSYMSVYRWLKQGALPRNYLVIKAVERFLARNGYPKESRGKFGRGQRKEVKQVRVPRLLTTG